MRPSWSASIVFNLVTIPVIAYKAIAEKKGLNLSMIHRKDGGKITTVKKCKICGEELFSKDIVKAYNLSNNTYVPIEKEELEEIKKKAESKVIEIQYFTDISTVSPILLDTSYYLTPKSGYERHFSLFMEVLKQSNKMGVGEITLRGKEKIVGILPYTSCLVLHTFYFADEVVEPPKAKIEKISKNETELATLLVDKLTKPFNPGKFKNTYAIRFKKLLENKIKNPKPTRSSKKNKVQAKADALLEALTASVKTLETGK